MNLELSHDHLNLHQLKTLASNQIWAVGGGKGGVGKSLMTANTALCLALMGHKVIAIDLDLGGANLHTCLGLPIPQKTLSDYISKRVDSLEELITPTPINGLGIISGAQDALGIANLKTLQKTKLLRKLKKLDADYIIMDLGAGTSFNTLDFFISADRGIITTLPEPTSIENSYRFIKSVYHRKLKSIDDFFDIGPLIDQAMNSKVHEDFTPHSLIQKVKELNLDLGIKLQREISSFSPKLVVNQARSQSDIDIGHSMQIICKKYFGISLDYLGHLEYDSAVWKSVKKRKPLLMEFPQSRLISNFDHLVSRLLEYS